MSFPDRVGSTILSGFVDLMNGQADEEGGALAGFAFGGDGAAVAVGDAAADGQADAGAFVFGAAMEALEHGEDFVGVFLVEANAVVLDGEFDLLSTSVEATATRVAGNVGAGVGANVDGGEGCVDELGGDVDDRDMGRRGVGI